MKKKPKQIINCYVEVTPIIESTTVGQTINIKTVDFNIGKIQGIGTRRQVEYRIKKIEWIHQAICDSITEPSVLVLEQDECEPIRYGLTIARLATVPMLKCVS